MKQVELSAPLAENPRRKQKAREHTDHEWEGEKYILPCRRFPAGDPQRARKAFHQL
ncbi:MAG: hypothetical protein ABW185_11480 [Sedimenticola sp.]